MGSVRLESQHDQIALDDFEDLLFERPEHEKWELIDGRVMKSMVGARWEHSDLIHNMYVALSHHLSTTGRPCRIFRESFYLKSAAHNLVAVPDIMVYCGALPPGVNSVDAPIVLIEVVSPGSERRDRLEKRIVYTRLPSLQHYTLVARDRVHVETHTRTPAGWQPQVPLEALDATWALEALGFTMPVAEIYRGVIAA